MPELSTLGVFIAAALALTITPGPAVLYITARSVEGGRMAGFVSVLGITVGGLVHTAFATVGLSAILASSQAAFAVVKWVGVAYLVWLGLSRLFVDTGNGGSEAVSGERRLSRIFWQGIVVDVLNPKVTLFFLAFLPQFVNPSLGAAWSQILVLGLIFAVVGLVSDSLYALLGGTAGNWLKRRSRGFERGKRYVTGSIYLALGAASAAYGRE